MPRLRIRRLLLFCVVGAVCTIIAMNFTSNSREALLVSKYVEQDAFIAGIGDSPVRRRPKFNELVNQQSPPSLSSKHKSLSSSSSSAANEYRNDIHSQTSAPNLGLPITNNGRKPWFMKGGDIRPEVNYFSRKALLWPEQTPNNDRIVEQLMYVPANYTSNWNFTSSSKQLVSATYQRQKLKKILLYFGKGGWNDLPLGRTVFLRDKCPVNTCELTTSLRDAESSDALFFKDRFLWPFYKRNPNQVWILFLLECPLHTQGFKNLHNVFNWTATYRHDSDIVAPYEKFVPYPEEPKFKYVNYALNKTKNVAWFVSNCNARNKRLEYAKELAQYIDVDIYGSCGSKRCPRTLTNRCFKILDKDYKFYLAFENSNCKDYITEKFFINALSRDIVPIVMGASREDYARSSPPHSYIHVDDFETPKDLANYLHMLNKNDTLYNEYFKWKGTGEFVNTYFWCRMCALLHAPLYHKSYPDMHAWWAGPGTCNGSTWRKKSHLSNNDDEARLKTDAKEYDDENG